MIAAISIKTLYEKIGNKQTDYGLRIHKTKDDETEQEYFDLINSNGDVACMDGEECVVMHDRKNNLFLCTNNNGEQPVRFSLSEKELAICAFL